MPRWCSIPTWLGGGTDGWLEKMIKAQCKAHDEFYKLNDNLLRRLGSDLLFTVAVSLKALALVAVSLLAMPFFMLKHIWRPIELRFFRKD